MDSQELTGRVAALAAGKLAGDIVALDMRELRMQKTGKTVRLAGCRGHFAHVRQKLPRDRGALFHQTEQMLGHTHRETLEYLLHRRAICR